MACPTEHQIVSLPRNRRAKVYRFHNLESLFSYGPYLGCFSFRKNPCLNQFSELIFIFIVLWFASWLNDEVEEHVPCIETESCLPVRRIDVDMPTSMYRHTLVPEDPERPHRPRIFSRRVPAVCQILGTIVHALAAIDSALR